MVMKRSTALAKLIKQSVNEFLTDNSPHLAAGISYYVLLSLFPLALAFISVAGFIVRSPDVEARLTQYIASSLPAAGDFMASTIRGVARSWTATGVMATVGLIWAGLGVFNAMRKALNTAWGVRQSRPFLRARLVELTMMIVITLLLLVPLGFTTVLSITGLDVPLYRDGSGGLFRNPLSALGTTFLAFLTFLFLYKFVPNTKVLWRQVWAGALIAAVVFVVVSAIFIWSLSSFARYNIIYGSLGALIAFLIWVYISALIMLFCAKLIWVYPKIMSSASTEASADES